MARVDTYVAIVLYFWIVILSNLFNYDFVTFLDIFGHLLRSCCFRLSRRPAIGEAANMIMMKIITSDNHDQNY